MKSKAQSIQARKKLFFPSIVKNYLCNVSFKFFITIESTWGCEIKEQTSHLTLLCCGRNVWNSNRGCSIKKLLLKKLPEGLQFIKNWPRHRCFSVNIAKFLRLPILKSICERLLFECFNSLLHRPKGSKFRLFNSIRIPGPSHRSRCLLLSWRLHTVALTSYSFGTWIPVCD